MGEITQESHFEMLEKLPDGNYKAKYPKVKSKSGVTFDEHLVDYALLKDEYETNKIIWDDKVAWKLLSTYTQATQSSSDIVLEFDIPSWVKELKIICSNLLSPVTSGQGNIYFTLNGLFVADQYQIYKDGAAMVKAYRTQTYLGNNNATIPGTITNHIHIPYNGMSRMEINDTIFNYAGVPEYGKQTAIWNNTQKVTKIRITISAGLKQGATFRMWGW